MGECRKRASHTTRASRHKFSSYVDSIRDNFKRISGIRDGNKSTEEEEKEVIQAPAGSPMMVYRQEDPNSHKRTRRRSSFEIFLSTIPRLDPVDRTVGWVMTQPETIVSQQQDHGIRLCCQDFPIQDGRVHGVQRTCIPTPLSPWI